MVIARSAQSSRIQTNRLLQYLPPEEIAFIEPLLISRSFPLGMVLQEAQDAITSVYFVDSGMVSLVVPLPDGEAVEIGIVGVEGAVSPHALIDATVSRIRAVVQIGGSGRSIGAQQLRAISPRCPTLTHALGRQSLLLFESAAQIAACNATHEVASRLATWILKSELHCRRSSLPLTHEFLAQMLSVRRPSVSVAAKQFQLRGLIEYRRKNIEIRDHAGLEAAACACIREFGQQVADYEASIGVQVL